MFRVDPHHGNLLSPYTFNELSEAIKAALELESNPHCFERPQIFLNMKSTEKSIVTILNGRLHLEHGAKLYLTADRRLELTTIAKKLQRGEAIDWSKPWWT